MKFFFITPTQKIQVDPYAFVNDKVSVELPDTDGQITFDVDIDKLETDKGVKVTRKMLSEFWDNFS